MTQKPTPAGGWRAPETQESNNAILNAQWPQINDVRGLALDLAERGAPITLCRGKRPISDAWQAKTWTPDEVAEAFRSDPDLGVGLVLGRRSGLIDVETDSPDADLTGLFQGPPPETPTFQSRRGTHRLYRWDDRLDALGKARVKLDGGDVLLGAGGKGAQCLLPPSVSNGFQRKWIAQPQACPFAPVPNPLIDTLLQLTVPLDLLDTSNPSTSLHVVHPSLGDDKSPSLRDRIEAAITETLPSGFGQRNRRVFALARRLKGLELLKQQLRPIVEDWHARALPVIRTKEFSETWEDFQIAWGRVKVPHGAVLSSIGARVPSRGSTLDRLAALCSGLQSAWGKRAFPLSQRIAAKVLGVPPTTAWRAMQVFKFQGVLVCVKRASKARRRAAEYRFMPGNGA